MIASLHEKRFHPFSIIELLIVISIISILSALLLPVLNSARDKARSIQCMNQQKQLGYAHLNYGFDNTEHFICSIPKNSDGSGMQWGRKLAELGYLLSRKYDVCLKKGLRCPVLPFQENHNASYGMFYSDNMAYFKSIWPHVYQVPGDTTGYGFLMNKMKRPSSIGLMGDSFYFESNTQWYQIRYQKATLPFCLPHSKRGNLLMADGHVRTWTKSELGKIYDHVPGSEFSNVVGMEF